MWTVHADNVIYLTPLVLVCWCPVLLTSWGKLAARVLLCRAARSSSW